MTEDTKDGTRVDLGEDLLEGPTRVSGVYKTAPPPEPVRTPGQEIDDQIHSARILMQEGLFEDAKKILRRVAITDPERRMARHLLKEIQEAELKQMLSEDPSARKRRRDEIPSELQGDSDEVMRKLDADLKLGIFPSERRDSLANGMSLFQDRRGMGIFGKKLEEEIAGSSIRQRLDLATAFCAMGLLEVATRVLKPSLQSFSGASGEELEVRLAALGTYSFAMIELGRPYDATLAIQPVLQDSEIGLEKKLELFYLMGIASESMDKPQEAAVWYEQAEKIDPYYRDLAVRFRGKKPRK